MEKDRNTLETCSTADARQKPWLSLEQWSQDPEFLKLAEKEFMSSPLCEEKDQGLGRREFLKLMGASLAMSSLSCVRRPAEKIVPYAKRPAEVTPGLPNYYASFLKDGHEVLSTVVKQQEARPIKLEGNELSPGNGEGLSARAHGALLSLYDPDRLKGPRKNLLSPSRLARDTVSVSWDELDQDVISHLSRGKSAILTSSQLSPTLDRLMGTLRGKYSTKSYLWDVEDLSEVIRAQQITYNERSLPVYHLDKAKVILSVGADFLGTYWQPTTFAKLWAKGRKKVRTDKDMSKLYMVEGDMSLTGANADVRMVVPPKDYVAFMVELLHELVVVQKKTSYAYWSELKESLKAKRASFSLDVDPAFIKSLAEDLWAARRDSLVMAGGVSTHTQEQLTLQVLVNVLNSALGSEGSMIQSGSASNETRRGSYSNLEKLVKDIHAGHIDTVIVHGCNPVYSGGLSNLDVAGAFKKLKLLVSTAESMDETSEISHYVASSDHFLESWAESNPSGGLHFVAQPVVSPLYQTRSFGDSLMKWGRRQGSYADYVKGYFQREVFRGVRVQKRWEEALHQGFVKLPSSLRRGRLLDRPRSLRYLRAWSYQGQGSSFQLSLKFSSALREGSLANVSWLQEMPDPVTKVCWGNYISVSYDVAQKLKIQEGQKLKMSVGSQSVVAPAYIQPGQHSKVLTLHLGYGRRSAGQVGNQVGVNAYSLASVLKGAPVYSGIEASLQVLEGQVEPLANVQGHHSMEGREIVVASSLKKYKKGYDPFYHGNGNENPSIWGVHDFKKKWSMVVDLNSCTGCSACVVACQAENNIPVVGKKYIINGREMHWIRLDRYYEGSLKIRAPLILFL